MEPSSSIKINARTQETLLSTNGCSLAHKKEEADARTRLRSAFVNKRELMKRGER